MFQVVTCPWHPSDGSLPPCLLYFSLYNVSASVILLVSCNIFSSGVGPQEQSPFSLWLIFTVIRH